MSDMNGLPPEVPNVPPQGNAPFADLQAPPPPGSPMQQNMYSGGMEPGGGNISGGNGMKFGVLIMLAAMTLLVPLGLYKIGSPHACNAKREKAGECKVLTNIPDGCTPSRFAEESEYLTCKMVGAVENEAFKEANAGKYDACMKLHAKITNSKFKCYALPGLLKKGPKGKSPDPFKMPPLEVQKLSILNSLSGDAMFQDLLFTILTMLLLLGGMAFAAFSAHKKNRDSFIWITAVFVVGIFAAYVYRYLIAGFYSGNIVVLIISLLGGIPIAVIVMGQVGKLGTTGQEGAPPPGEFVVEVKAPAPVPEEPISMAEATRFEKMALRNTSIGEKVFILGFISLVLMLLPIGLYSMGKTSKADSAMKKEAAKLTSLVKKKATASSSDVGATDEGTGGEGGGEDGLD